MWKTADYLISNGRLMLISDTYILSLMAALQEKTAVLICDMIPVTEPNYTSYLCSAEGK